MAQVAVDFENQFKEFTLAQTGASLDSRKAVLEHLLMCPIPSKRDELWKYFSSPLFLPAIRRQKFKTNTKLSASEATRRVQISQNLLRGFALSDYFRIVIYNGELLAEMSELTKTQGKIKFRQELVDEPGRNYFHLQSQVFSPFKLELTFAAGITPTKPILLAWINDDLDSSLSYPALDLKLETGADVKLVEFFAGGIPDGLVNAQSTIHISKDSALEFVQLQALSTSSLFYSTTDIAVEANAKLNQVSLAKGARFSRHDLTLSILGSQAEIRSGSAVLGDQAQEFEHVSTSSHLVGGSHLRQLCKTALAGEAKAAFTGKIHMAPGAQKAESEQLVRNLLLSNSAKAFSRPQLEIYADDVKATHGASTGRLDADELFYLQSRGLTKLQSETILREGFLLEVVHLLREPSLRRDLAGFLTSFKESLL